MCVWQENHHRSLGHNLASQRHDLIGQTSCILDQSEPAMVFIVVFIIISSPCDRGILYRTGVRDCVSRSEVIGVAVGGGRLYEMWNKKVLTYCNCIALEGEER